MEIMETEKSDEKIIQYSCDSCQYITGDKRDYNKHLLTQKHIVKTFGTKKSDKNLITSNGHVCSCGKTYKTKSGLWKHKPKCTIIKMIDIPEKTKEKRGKNKQGDVDIDSKMVLQILEQNQELQRLLGDQQQQYIDIINKQQQQHQNNIKDLLPKIGHNTTNMINVKGDINNKFNINLFLNEQCKDAMSLVDFVDDLHISLPDLLKTGELGFVEGVSSIFLRGLKALDVTKRPIHCSDMKRETLYIKDQHAWSKEDSNQTRIQDAIAKVKHDSFKQLDSWIEEHPNYTNVSHPDNKEYMNLVANCLGSSSDEISRQNKTQRVIKTIAREVFLSDAEHTDKN